MIDYRYFYIYASILSDSIPLFISFFALPCHYNCFIRNFWAKFSWIYLSNFSLAWPFFFFLFCFFSSILSLAFISVTFKYFSNGVTVFLFASRQASYFFLVGTCHIIPSFSNFLINFLLFFFHFWHLVYKYTTNCTGFLYYQH